MRPANASPNRFTQPWAPLAPATSRSSLRAARRAAWFADRRVDAGARVEQFREKAASAGLGHPLAVVEDVEGVVKLGSADRSIFASVKNLIKQIRD